MVCLKVGSNKGKTMTNVQEIKAAVLNLTREDQAEIADAILANIADPGPLSDAWKAELDRREAAYQRGEVELIDNAEALARLRARRGSPFGGMRLGLKRLSEPQSTIALRARGSMTDSRRLSQPRWPCF